MPETFTLTQMEAEKAQAVQFARQTAFARGGANLRIVAVAFPIIAIGLLFAVDWFVLNGNTSSWCFLGLLVAYLLGTFMQVLAARITVTETKKRMLKQTPQVWEQRTVEIKEDGLNQLTETASSLFYWSAIKSIERHGEILFVWVTEFNPVVVPDRAFLSKADTKVFETEVRGLAA